MQTSLLPICNSRKHLISLWEQQVPIKEEQKPNSNGSKQKGYLMDLIKIGQLG